jgi:hypothetical protein
VGDVVVVTNRTPRPFASCASSPAGGARERSGMSILWIILIVVLVLVLLGFVGRGFR